MVATAGPTGNEDTPKPKDREGLKKEARIMRDLP